MKIKITGDNKLTNKQKLLFIAEFEAEFEKHKDDFEQEVFEIMFFGYKEKAAPG